MHLRIKAEIKAHALRDAPNECCGFIYINKDTIKTFPCKNVSTEPQEEFEVDMDEYFEATRQGVIVGIYHSGRDLAFSESDIHHADEWPLPLHLYSLKENTFKTYTPKTYGGDYLGRTFIWGHHDCYTLVKDYYRREYNLYLNDYDCDETYESSGKRDIIQNIEKEGFEKLKDISNIKAGDVLVFYTFGEYHIAIYLGNNQFLHQLLKSQSRIDNLDELWAKRLKFALHHTSRL